MALQLDQTAAMAQWHAIRLKVSKISIGNSILYGTNNKLFQLILRYGRIIQQGSVGDNSCTGNRVCSYTGENNCARCRLIMAVSSDSRSCCHIMQLSVGVGTGSW